MEFVDDFTEKDLDSPSYRMRGGDKILVTIFSQLKPIGGGSPGDEKEIHKDDKTKDVDAFNIQTLFRDKYKVEDNDIEVHNNRKIEEVLANLKDLDKKGDKYDMFFFVFLTYLEKDVRLQFYDKSTTLDELINVIKDNSTLRMKPKIFIVQADDLGKYKDPKVRAKGPTVLKPLKIPCDADRLVIMSTIPQFLAKKLPIDEQLKELSLADPKSTKMVKKRSLSSLMIQAFVSVMSDPTYKSVDLLSRTPLINGQFQELVDDLELTGDYAGLEIPIPLVTSTLTKLVMM